MPTGDRTHSAIPIIHSQTRSRVREGLAFPLGTTWDGLGVNFAIFSAHASKIELCLFDNDGRKEVERIALPEYTDGRSHSLQRRRARRRPDDPGALPRRAHRGAIADDG
jgi:hypothetical protein